MIPEPGRRMAAFILLILAAAACGDDRMEMELASDLYARPLRAVVQRQVDVSTLPPADASVVIGEEKRVFSIGARDGDERYLFGRLAGVAVSATGDTLFALDRMERRVKAFSREGRFLFYFGRRGKGPGEYEDPVAITTLPWNGGIAVWDSASQRLTVLTAMGQVLHTSEPLRQNEIARQGRRLRAYDGGFVLESRSDPYTTTPDRQRGYLVRLDTLGAVHDTLAEFAIPAIHGSTQQGNAGLVSHMTLNAPYWTPEPIWGVDRHGEVSFAPGGPYEIYRVAEPAVAKLKLRRAWQPERLTRRERAANLADAQRRAQLSRDVPLFVLELMHRKRFAVVRPSLTGLLVDQSGRTWARRFDVTDDPEGFSRTWDTYLSNGAPGESLRFTAGFTPLLVHGDRVYGIRRDALDVDRLEAYRL